MMTEARVKLRPDPVTGAAALLLRLGVAVLAILIPCAAVVSRRPLFVLMPIGAVLVILGSRLAPERRPRTIARLTRATKSTLGIATLLLVFWAGLSLAWTAFPNLAFDHFLKAAGTALIALLALGSLPNRVRGANSNLLAIGVAGAAIAVIAVAILDPQAARIKDVEANTIQRAAIGVIVLSWPALGALALRERFLASGILAAVVAFAAALIWSPAALAALILAILVFSLAYNNPVRMGLALGALAAAALVLAPVIPLAVTNMFSGRIDAHDAMAAFPAWAAIIKSDGWRVMSGHGFDASVRAYMSGRLAETAPRGLLFEVWYELGAVGACIMATLLFQAFQTAGRAPRTTAPYLLATLTCIFALSALGLPLGQLWWLTLLGVASICFAIATRSQENPIRIHAPVLGAASPSSAA